MRLVYLSIPLLCLFLVIPQPLQAISFTYTGDAIPATVGNFSKDYWSKSTDNAIPATIETDDGRTVLHLNDNSFAGGSHLFLSRQWDVVPSNWYNTATFVVKAVSCSGYMGSVFGMQSKHSDGYSYHAYYVLYPDRVQLYGHRLSHIFDTTSAYNAYTVLFHKGVSTIYINGEYAFSHAANTGLYMFPRNGVEFGAGSSGATGEAYWDHVSASQIPIPEPSTILLFSLGLMGIVARRFKRNR